MADSAPVASLRQMISSRIGVLSDNTAARALYLDYGFRPYIETLSKHPEGFHSQPRLVADGDTTIEERSGSSE